MKRAQKIVKCLFAAFVLASTSTNWLLASVMVTGGGTAPDCGTAYFNVEYYYGEYDECDTEPGGWYYGPLSGTYVTSDTACSGTVDYFWDIPWFTELISDRGDCRSWATGYVTYYV